MLKHLNNALCAAALGVAFFTGIPATFAGETMTSSKEVKAVVEPEPVQWWNAAITLGADSQYNFRGVDILPNDGQFWTDLNFTAKGFKVGVWLESALSKNYDEFDAYASYSHAFGPVSFEVGYIFYLFPKSHSDTHEGFAGVTYTPVSWLTTSLYYYRDFALIDGNYFEAKVSSTIPLYKDVVKLNPYVLFGFGDYNSNDFETDHVGAGVSLAVSLSKNITLSGYGAYSHALDAIKGNYAGTSDDEFWGGASIGFTF